MPTTHLLPRSAPSAKGHAALAALVVWGLLVMQSLGLWHGLTHRLGPVARAALVQVAAPAPTDLANATASQAAAKLFTHPQGDADCQLYDQLCHADVLAGIAVTLLTHQIPHDAVRVSHGLAVARWHALFQARGPPSVP